MWHSIPSLSFHSSYSKRPTTEPSRNATQLRYVDTFDEETCTAFSRYPKTLCHGAYSASTTSHVYVWPSVRNPGVKISSAISPSPRQQHHDAISHSLLFHKCQHTHTVHTKRMHIIHAYTHMYRHTCPNTHTHNQMLMHALKQINSYAVHTCTTVHVTVSINRKRPSHAWKSTLFPLNWLHNHAKTMAIFYYENNAHQHWWGARGC